MTKRKKKKSEQTVGVQRGSREHKCYRTFWSALLLLGVAFLELLYKVLLIPVVPLILV